MKYVVDSSVAVKWVLQISSAARIGVYDCLYVALAEREKCELVTADDKLIKNLQPSFPFRRAAGVKLPSLARRACD